MRLDLLLFVDACVFLHNHISYITLFIDAICTHSTDVGITLSKHSALPEDGGYLTYFFTY